MASTRFGAAALNHKKWCDDPTASTWDPPKVRRVVTWPYNWITADEAEAIIATEGVITASWYDQQHAVPVAGTDMEPDPNYGVLAVGEVI